MYLDHIKNGTPIPDPDCTSCDFHFSPKMSSARMVSHRFFSTLCHANARVHTGRGIGHGSVEPANFSFAKRKADFIRLYFSLFTLLRLSFSPCSRYTYLFLGVYIKLDYNNGFSGCNLLYCCPFYCVINSVNVFLTRFENFGK